MTVYRLYTEANDNLLRIVTSHVNGATFYQAIGLWQGHQELSTIIEVVGASRETIDRLREYIRLTNHQQSVGLMVLEVETEGF